MTGDSLFYNNSDGKRRKALKCHHEMEYRAFLVFCCDSVLITPRGE